MKFRQTRALTSVLLLITFAPGVAPNAAQNQDDGLRKELIPGRDLIFGGRYDDAVSSFSGVARKHPASPAGDFYLAVTLIWKSYVDAKLETGARTFDEEIEAALTSTIKKAEALRAREEKTEGDEIEGLYYLGSAWAIRSRLAFFQNHAIPAARAARMAQDFFGFLVKLKPDYYDAYFAAGSIYYRVGLLTDSSLGRVASSVLGPKALPVGDRAKGIAYLKTAAEKGELTDVDAKLALIEVLTLNENRNDEALAYARELQAKYPDNQTVARYLLRIYQALKDRAKLTQTAQLILARVKSGRRNFGPFMKAEAEKFLAEAGKM